MAETDQGERTEEATEQRKEEFRRKGQVAQTKELSSCLLLLISALVVWLLGRFFLGQIAEVFSASFTEHLLEVARTGAYQKATIFAMVQMGKVVIPICVIFLVFGLAASLVQTGWLTNEEALQFKPERLNPVEGLKKMWSARSAVEGLKATIKVALVAIVAYFILESEVPVLPRLIYMDVAELFEYFSDVSFRLLGGVGLFMGALAGLDYFFQRWDLSRKMRMTKQEVKEEHKAREGDPLVKARVRKIQREMAQKRMMEEVPKADVVITNPTHIAVALKYDETMVAPKVIAKGADRVAQKIKEIARENGVPLVENKPLARSLYKTLQIGESVPRELYKAVAEVLAYVYRLKRKLRH